MSKLYLITGPCEIGKSTISKELAFNFYQDAANQGHQNALEKINLCTQLDLLLK